MSLPIYAPNQLTKGARGLFMMQVAMESPTWVDKCCTIIPSDSDSEIYSWLGESSQMEEFEDEIKFRMLSDTNYTLANKKYVSALAVRRDDIADDKTQGIAMRIRQMAEVGARHPNALITAALVAGTTDLCHDGDQLFDDTHRIRGQQTATQDNLLGGTGTSTAQVATDLSTVIGTLAGFLGENNEPINEGFKKLWVMYPSGIHKPMAEAVKAIKVGDTDNVQFDGMTIDLISNPRLVATDVNDWYAGIGDSIVKGLIYQDREPLTFESSENQDSDIAFTREVYQYKARARRRVGYGLWHKVVKVVNT